MECIILPQKKSELAQRAHSDEARVGGIGCGDKERDMAGSGSSD